MNRRYDFYVVEDNAGGIHLIVEKEMYDSFKIVGWFSDYEYYGRDRLFADMKAVMCGDVHELLKSESNNIVDEASFKEADNMIYANDCNYTVICENVRNNVIITPAYMGSAGRYLFDIGYNDTRPYVEIKF